MYITSQKQQNSLIAGLRATNDALHRQDLLGTTSGNVSADITSGGTSNNSMDKKESTSPECFDPLAEHSKDTGASTVQQISAQPHTIPSTSSQSAQATTVQAEQMRLRKKSQNILNRSDSTGSTSGRKFLAPTLSDPQAHRSDKYSQKKKPNSFIGATGSGVSNSNTATTPTATSSGRTVLSSSSNSGLSALTSATLPPTPQSATAATDKTVSLRLILLFPFAKDNTMNILSF